MSLSSLAAQLRTAFYELALDEFSTEIAAEDVVVAYSDFGLPSADGAVFIGNVSANQEAVTTNRGREVTLLILVNIQFFSRDMDNDADKIAWDGMTEAAHRLSERARREAPNGDTTLGGIVRTCAEVDMNTEALTATSQTGEGRIWVGEITYEAKARLRG